MAPQQFLFPSGVLAPIVTPLHQNYKIHTGLFVDHAFQVLDEGCVGVVPFGTTGEAFSVGVKQRMTALESLVSGGVHPSQILVGAGQTNLGDTINLTRHALEVGSSGVLVLPPFYYKNPSSQGLYEYFSAFIDEVSDSRLKIVLYHIPQVAGVGFPISVVKKLHEEFPGVIAGIKDSSGDWGNTKELLEIKGLDVYPGSERTLLDAMPLNARGCITATANVAAPMLSKIVKSYLAKEIEEAETIHSLVMGFREVLEKHPPIAAIKAIKRKQARETNWNQVFPPLETLSDSAASEVNEAFEKMQNSFSLL
ncbi:MAG: 4-hydroxy-tetrahydrodipicolinate synthase [Acidimicrobiales bacterium AG-410-I20]|nr:MAG: 4-hydroxy-tetrahydrodipicolinate synthase [Acidimicrobiales bacterium AG-410-I20]